MINKQVLPNLHFGFNWGAFELMISMDSSLEILWINLQQLRMSFLSGTNQLVFWKKMRKYGDFWELTPLPIPIIGSELGEIVSMLNIVNMPCQFVSELLAVAQKISLNLLKVNYFCLFFKFILFDSIKNKTGSNS